MSTARDTVTEAPRAAAAAAGRRLRHVAYFMQTPLNARDFERYGMAEMAARGIAVTVVDLKPILNPELQEPPADPGRFPTATLLQAGSMARLRTHRRRLATADFIICLAAFTGSPASLGVHRFIRSLGRPVLTLAVNAYPGAARAGGGPPGRLAHALSRLLGGDLNPLHSILYRLPDRLLGIKAPEMIVHGGRASHALDRLWRANGATRRIQAHSMDYETFLNARADAEPADIAVFIDENTCFERDAQAMGVSRITEPERFYPPLRALFERIERDLGLEVVIAGNPRADYAEPEALFGKRRIEFGATAGLIAESRLVLAQRSTAIGLAVMTEKPILLLATADTYAHWINQASLDLFAGALDKPLQFFDDPNAVDLGVAFDTDTDAYASYMREYVTEGNAGNRRFWEIVTEAMEAFLADNRSGAGAAGIVEKTGQ